MRIPSAEFGLHRLGKIAACTLTEHSGMSNLLRWTKQRLSLISPYRVSPGFYWPDQMIYCTTDQLAHYLTGKAEAH